MSPWRRPKKQPRSDQSSPERGTGQLRGGSGSAAEGGVAEGGVAESSAAEQRADVLYDRANRLMMSEPGTPQAAEATEEAVRAALLLASASDTPGNQRRLARALWRRTSAYLTAGNGPAAAESARLCWTLCGRLLADAAADAAAFDELAGLVIFWCGGLGPALVLAGAQREADRMAKALEDIAARAQGPRGRQARARMAFGNLVEEAATIREAMLDGRGDQITDAVQRAVARGRATAEVLRDYVADGPYEVDDLARMLHILCRLYMFAGQYDEAAAVQDEAISVATPVAGVGPRFAEHLADLQAFGDMLRGATPDAGPGTHPPLTAVTDRAFLRAARDLGELGGGLFPGDVAAAAVTVERLRSQEAGDPARHGPRRGLAMAWHADLLTNAGQAAAARGLASQATRQLMRFSDTPEQIQAALAVALSVEATARQATGDADGARSVQDRADTIRTLLARRDSTYADDLGTPGRRM